MSVDFECELFELTALARVVDSFAAAWAGLASPGLVWAFFGLAGLSALCLQCIVGRWCDDLTGPCLAQSRLALKFPWQRFYLTPLGLPSLV